MDAPIVVRAVTSLPDDIDRLLRPSLDEGHDLVQRLVQDWVDGSNRFDKPGEVAIEARVGDHLAGVGGLNRDPYLDNPRVGRIRHLYVTPDLRRSGVGRQIMGALVGHARTHFSWVRLRTIRSDAARFYTTLGFEEVDEDPDATHIMHF